MKKYIDLAFGYAVAAIACGVFYREFTKFHQFDGRTALGFAHPHLLVLGALVFLLVALFVRHTPLAGQKLFRPFLVTYNIGLPLTAAMFFVRGIPQVLGTPLTGAASAAVSGVAGIGHTLVTLGLVFLFLSLRRSAD